MNEFSCEQGCGRVSPDECQQPDCPHKLEFDDYTVTVAVPVGTPELTAEDIAEAVLHGLSSHGYPEVGEVIVVKHSNPDDTHVTGRSRVTLEEEA